MEQRAGNESSMSNTFALVQSDASVMCPNGDATGDNSIPVQRFDPMMAQYAEVSTILLDEPTNVENSVDNAAIDVPACQSMLQGHEQ